ncbi:Alpha/Beta hydrolase protein [Mucidula mucida]|nr:Alpha/Beta hydrolase protein [Mucidula mucida]
MPTSRVVPGRYPAPGSSQIADAIRERRGARGLTPLDGTLLHVPPVAQGWNSLLGAIRTKGSLPGDVRELMILRVAAHNHAAFEWIHHEHVGRDADTSSLPTDTGVLSALQLSALTFAHESTTVVKVSKVTTEALKTELQNNEDLLVEAAAVVATYNMVSRFLMSLDVAGMSDEVVPWPADVQEHKVSLPDSPEHYIYAQSYTVSPNAPWLVFCNSLLTDTTTWSFLLLIFSRPPDLLIFFSMINDVALVLKALSIPKVHAVVGVSQGGAVALSFGTQFPALTDNVVACDTSPKTPAGNKEAWESRIAVAKEKGMHGLADITAPRWFPDGSPLTKPRREAVDAMIENTSIEGFAIGANALMEYDLYEDGLEACQVRTLLVAGELDGGGNVAMGLRALKERWSAGKVDFQAVSRSGHLPMIDATEKFWEVLRGFLV